jgi:hypothetical protein
MEEGRPIAEHLCTGAGGGGLLDDKGGRRRAGALADEVVEAALKQSRLAIEGRIDARGIRCRLGVLQRDAGHDGRLRAAGCAYREGIGRFWCRRCQVLVGGSGRSRR